jgi:hypothetical protein
VIRDVLYDFINANESMRTTIADAQGTLDNDLQKTRERTHSYRNEDEMNDYIKNFESQITDLNSTIGSLAKYFDTDRALIEGVTYATTTLLITLGIVLPFVAFSAIALLFDDVRPIFESEIASAVDIDKNSANDVLACETRRPLLDMLDGGKVVDMIADTMEEHLKTFDLPALSGDFGDGFIAT